MSVCTNLLNFTPPDKLSITFSKSSGPGGQNVNKGIEWRADHTRVFPPRFVLQLGQKRYLSKSGMEGLGMRLISMGDPQCTWHILCTWSLYSEHKGGGEIPCGLCRLAAREGQRTTENDGEHVIAYPSGHTLIAHYSFCCTD